MTRYFAFF